MGLSTLADRDRRLVVSAGAVLAVVVATAILAPYSPSRIGTTTPAIVYVLLVLGAALAGGRTAGSVAAGTAFIAQLYFFVPPDHAFGIEDGKSGIGLAVFAIAEVAVCLVGASQRDARLRAASARTRAARLQRFTSSLLSRAPTTQAVYDAALQEGRALLAADAALVAILADDAAGVELVAAFGFTDEETAPWRHFPLSQRTPIGEAIEGGLPVFLGQHEREIGIAGSGAGAPTAFLPLRVGDETLGALGYRFGHGHVFDDTGRELTITVGELCAYALQRARVFDAERRGRRSLDLLAAIGEQLARSLDPDEALLTLADLAVPAFADQCIVDSVSGDDVHRLVVVNADPEVREAALVLECNPPVLTSDTPVAVAIRAGEPQVVESTADLPASAYRSPEHRAAVQRVGIRTMIAAPMRVRGRTLGALTFGWQSETRPDDDQRQLAGQIARRVALALDNGTLYQEAHGERERLGALVRQLPLGVIIAESSSRKLLFTNQRAQELLGHGASEHSIAGPHAELVHRALEGESTPASEAEVVRADGSLGIVSLSAEPVRDAGGRIVAAVATLFDLTEHRRREQALTFLAEASTVLAETLDVQRRLADLAQLAVPRLADWCTIDLLEGEEIRTVGVAHADPATAHLARRPHARRHLRAEGSGGVPAALGAGRSQLIADVPAYLAGQSTPDAELLALSRTLGVRSTIVAPIAVHGRVFGALTLATAQSGRQYSEEDLSIAEDLAHRAALALENARLYRVEHNIAHALQRSLLPGALTQPEGAEIAASYRPAGEGAEVGGDFYDTWVHGGVHFLAIGDVAGHGPPAAALTNLTRQAMRVVSRYETSPARILAVVNETIRAQTAPEQFCTAALATLRPSEGGYRLTVACAGHPPPVVVRAASGEPEQVGSSGALLGVVADRDYDDRECLLGLGDLVAFWTDGVTERRGTGAMFGEERLLSLLAGAANQPAADVARELDEAVIAFGPGLPHDDVAILVARVTAVVGASGGVHGHPHAVQST